MTIQVQWGMSMKPNLYSFILFAGSFLLGTSSFAQELPAESLSGHESQIEAAHREGDSAVLSEGKIISELEQSELALYALFNDLNSSDEFDVVCKRAQLENGDFAALVCEPVFLETLRQQVADEQTNSSSEDAGFFARIRNKGIC